MRHKKGYKIRRLENWPASSYKGQSAHNQSKESIKFHLLEMALESGKESTGIRDFNKIKEFDRDHAVKLLNEITSKGIRPSRRFITMILKKFSHNRSGEEERAEKLYSFIKTNNFPVDREGKYGDFDNFDADSEMMLAYLRRHPRTKKGGFFDQYWYWRKNSKSRKLSKAQNNCLEKIKGIFEKNENVFTFNALLMAHLCAYNFIEANALLKQYSNYKDDWTTDLRLKYFYFSNAGNLEKTNDYFYEMLQNKGFIVGATTIVTMLKFNKNSFEKVMSIYNGLLYELKFNNCIRREMIKNLFSLKKNEQAIKFFNETPDHVKYGPIYTPVISFLYEHGKVGEAIDIYDAASKKQNSYKANAPDIDEKYHTVTIDLHDRRALSGGSPGYIPLPWNIAEVALLHLERTIDSISKKCQHLFKMEVICGKGTYEFRDHIKGFIEKKLENWKNLEVDLKNLGVLKAIRTERNSSKNNVGTVANEKRQLANVLFHRATVTKNGPIFYLMFANDYWYGFLANLSSEKDISGWLTKNSARPSRRLWEKHSCFNSMRQILTGKTDKTVTQEDYDKISDLPDLPGKLHIPF